MPFPYDKYPWLNFQELNLAYFIKHFREIFQEWNTLYHDLAEWKDATEQELEQWKTETMAGLDAWRALTLEHLENSVEGWETDTLAALDAWKAAFEAEYADLKTEVEGIRDQAAANADSASDSAGAAALSASAAQAAQTAAETAAAGIQSELAQIQRNTDDISDLKTQLLSQVISDNFEINGGIRADDGVSVQGEGNLTSINTFSRSDCLSIETINDYIFYLYCWDENGYLGSYKTDTNSFTPVVGTSRLTYFNLCDWPENYRYKIVVDPENGDAESLDEKINVLFSVNALGPDSSLTKAGDAADAKATGDAIKAGLTEIIHDYSADVETDWIITTLSGTPWRKQGTATLSRAKIFKLPSGTEKVSITSQTDHSAIVSFLRSFCPVQGATPDYAMGWARTSIPADTTAEYAIPADAQYMYTNVTLSAGADVTPEEVKITCLRSEEDPAYLYPYDTDTQDETGKHDRSEEIMLMLNHYGTCKLANGIYYVSGVTMPEKSSIAGDGRGAEIRLLQSVTAGTAVKMDAQCLLLNLTISGGYSDRTPGWSGDITIGSRNGAEWTGDTMDNGCIENCCFRNFEGAGLYLHDTTTATSRNLVISNCYFKGNDVGVDIRKNSEFNRIVNCTFNSNYIGYRNRGGNNNISNCGIDWNKTGILIDNAEGTNGGHGTITGCSINHSNYSNIPNGRPTGDGLIITGTGRMVISNCNFYYSVVKLIDTNGNIISGSGFGTRGALQISGGECSMVVNCMFLRALISTDPDVYEPFPITITNNVLAKVLNCYDRNGYEYGV